MIFSLQLLVSGLAIGAIYGLVANSLSITYATSRSINFSQGQSVMLGAVTYYSLTQSLGVPALLGTLVTLAAGALFGFLVFKVSIAPFMQAKSNGWLLSTIALGLAIESLTLAVFGRESRALASPFGNGPLRMAGIGILPHEFAILILSIVLALFSYLLLFRTVTGVLYRAVAQNELGSRLIGIDTNRIVIFSYLISTTLAFLAGIAIAPLLHVSATMGRVIGLKAFAIAAFAGLDQPKKILYVSLFFGTIEAMVAGWLGSGFRDLCSFSSLFLAMCIFPNGLRRRTPRVV